MNTHRLHLQTPMELITQEEVSNTAGSGYFGFPWENRQAASKLNYSVLFQKAPPCRIIMAFKVAGSALSFRSGEITVERS